MSKDTKNLYNGPHLMNTFLTTLVGERAVKEGITDKKLTQLRSHAERVASFADDVDALYQRLTTLAEMFRRAAKPGESSALQDVRRHAGQPLTVWFNLCGRVHEISLDERNSEIGPEAKGKKKYYTVIADNRSETSREWGSDVTQAWGNPASSEEIVNNIVFQAVQNMDAEGVLAVQAHVVPVLQRWAKEDNAIKFER